MPKGPPFLIRKTAGEVRQIIKGRKIIRGFYPIIDNSLLPSLSNIEIARRMLSGGAKILQLRGKGLSSRELLTEAGEIKKLAEEADAIFIVNDRVDIALLSGADGVHLGQDDLPVSEARKIMGDERLIGISTHTLDQALMAETDGADYIGFGPVFETGTKAGSWDARGVPALQKVKETVSLPVVAIGGINLENVREVISSGVDGVAVISAILTANSIEEATRRFLDACKF